MAYLGDRKRAYQRKWIKERRAKYIAELGPCVFCGGTEDITIHHRDPSKKVSHRIWSWSDERLRKELAKCDPVCRACHEKHHAKELRKPLVHGTRNGYERHGCRCAACRAANRLHEPVRWIPVEQRRLFA